MAAPGQRKNSHADLESGYPFLESGYPFARPQSVYQDLRNQIARRNEDGHLSGPSVVYCDCCHADCYEEIELTAALYAAVRRRPSCFVLKPGHEKPEVERVMETHPGYVLTETR